MSVDKLTARLRREVLIFDGAMGTELYRRHFFINTSFENLVLSSPETVCAIHQSYIDAGCDVLTSNTYNANVNKLGHFGLSDRVGDICRAAVALARECAGPDTLIAGSVGPAGERTPACAALSDAEIVGLPARELAAAGADFILFESLGSVAAVRAAVSAAETFDLPYVLSMVLAADGRGIGSGDEFAAMLAAVMAAARPPAALGLNCGQGPEATLKAFEHVAALSALPWIIQPNAGEPKKVDNRTMYMNSPEYFTTYALRYVGLGARGVGGCCGIGPEHIAEMCRAVRPLARGNAQGAKPVITVADGVEALPETPLAERSGLGAKLARGEWVTTVEITPPTGFELKAVVAKARTCREAGVDAINLPDGPRASSRLSTLVTALEIQAQAGIETVLHMCARDRSLIGLQAELLGCACEDVRNILFVTGDPPKLGNFPFSSGVFDVDAIGMVQMQKHLNQGIDLGGRALGMQTSAVIGVGIDPNAIDLEREYRRICEKAAAGAEFIVTQPVFAPEKLLSFLNRIGHLKLPVIAGVWPLASLRNAEFMKNEVPGVVVPDEIMTRMGGAADKEGQKAIGIAIARECVGAIRAAVNGIQVSAPFGNVQTAIAVLAD